MSREEAGGRIYVYSFICRQRKIFLFWGFILLAFLPSWWTGFVWDDVQYILQNPDLRTWQGLFRIWFVPSSSPQYYPLTFSTFWIEYQLWGLDPAGYKLVNLILHGANAFLLWTIIDTCSVSMKAVARPARKPTKTKRKPRPPESSSWSAECEVLRHRGGEISVVTTSYVIAGSGRLQSIDDIRVSRGWSKP